MTTVISTDNRDLNTTDLILSDGQRIEVDPVSLILNALENHGHILAYEIVRDVLKDQTRLSILETDFSGS